MRTRNRRIRRAATARRSSFRSTARSSWAERIGYLAGCGLRLACLVDDDQVRLEATEVSAAGRARRLAFVCVVAVLGVGALAVRLSHLQGEEHRKWQQIAARQHEATVKVRGARGTMYDRNGRILAVSVPALAIGAHPHQVRDTKDAATVLASLANVRTESVAEKLESKKSFVWIARGLPRKAADLLARHQLEGVAAYPEFRRYYPQEHLAAALLGRVGRDGNGLSGLELEFHDRLAAAALQRSVGRDARGRLVTAAAWDGGAVGLQHAALGDAAGVEGVRSEGADIQLSIDSVIQHIVETELERGKRAAKARRAFALVMDAVSGELLSIAQTGDLNPNQLEDVSPADLRNVVVQDSFEPGSTLKPLVAAAALEAGVVRPDEMLDCENGRYRIGGHTVRDVHPIGIEPFPEVLVRSSNVCMTKLGERLGRKRLHDALARLGFGAPTGIELRGEAKGILRPAERWRTIDIATHSFGQGVAVTALQLTRAYAALANGGVLVRPTLLKQPETARAQGEQVLSEAVADRTGEILAGVTESEHGTGKRAKIPGLTVYGKTGTAQKARVDGRGYDPDRVLSSFIGFVHGQPQGIDRSLVMFVVVDEPTVSPRWGGTVAGPIFRRSMEQILSHLLTSGSGSLQTAALGKRIRTASS